MLALYASEIKAIVDLGVQVSRGNWRRKYLPRYERDRNGIERAQGDYMGMLLLLLTAWPCRPLWNG